MDLSDTVDICFTVIADFVDGHRYGYNRDSSNYYEGHNRTKQNLMAFHMLTPRISFGSDFSLRGPPLLSAMFPARFLAQSSESILDKCLQYVRIDFYAQGDAMRPPINFWLGRFV